MDGGCAFGSPGGLGFSPEIPRFGDVDLRIGIPTPKSGKCGAGTEVGDLFVVWHWSGVWRGISGSDQFTSLAVGKNVCGFAGFGCVGGVIEQKKIGGALCTGTDNDSGNLGLCTGTGACSASGGFGSAILSGEWGFGIDRSVLAGNGVTAEQRGGGGRDRAGGRKRGFAGSGSKIGGRRRTICVWGKRPVGIGGGIPYEPWRKRRLGVREGGVLG